MIVRLKLILAFLVFAATSYAQISTDQYSFNFYSSAQGLSNNSVICLAEDYMGFLWIGTKDGLNRFDGRTFKVYRNIPGDFTSISNNYISTIFQDKDSILWIGTRGGGICRFNRKTDSFTSFLYNDSDSRSISHPEVLRIFQDNDGVIWVGTDGGGISRYNRDSETFDRFNQQLPISGGLSSVKILAIAEYDKNNLLLGTWDGGLNIFNKKTGKSSLIEASPHKLKSNNIWFLKNDEEAGFWVGHFENGLQYFDSKTGEFTTINFPEKNMIHSVYSIIKQEPNRLWIGTSAGIYTTTYSIRNRKLSTDSLMLFNDFFSLQIFQSHDGSFWAANYDNGLMHIRLNDPQFRFVDLSKSLFKDNYVNLFTNAFAEGSAGEIYIGTTQGGIQFDFKTKNISILDVPEQQEAISRRVVVLSKDSDNQIYAGKSLYLAKLDKKKRKFEKFLKLSEELNDHARDGYYDLLFEKNWVWLATENGLFKYNLQNKSFVSVIKTNAKFNGYNIYQVHSIASDSENVYAATLGGGLVVINKLSGFLRIFQNKLTDANSISSNQLNQVYVAKNGDVWLATFNGLNYFDKKKLTFKHFGIKEGFQAEFLTAITEDLHGNLWISSQHGISKYDSRLKTVYNFYFFDQEREKSFQVKAAFTSKNGEIYFGRRGGFICFQPDSIYINSNPPRVLVTDFKINNKSVKVSDNSVLHVNIESTQQIDLSYNQRSFSFIFAAMNFSFAERNQYAYKLESFNNDWVYTSDIEANYTNVPPGDYIFRVKASNQDGVWNDEGISIKISIHPAIWQTWLFKIILALCVLTILGIWYNWRTYRIKRDKKHLQELVAVQTNELMEKNIVLGEQNEELKQHKEELQFQRDTLEETNLILEGKKDQIENQNIELEQHRANLEQLVEDRTLELRKAKEKAEESDRLKSAFLANFSHEIRTPLNAIVGFSSLIDSPNITDEKRERYKQIIQSNSDSLLVLIDDILNLAKIEADQIELQISYFSVNDLLNELFQMFSEQKIRPGVELRIASFSGGQDVQLHSDSFRIKQIMINLISNALKFTSKGIVEFGVKIPGSAELHLFVRDTGIGIEPQFHQSIFERFRKLESNQDKLYRGTGLGLAICKKLTELCGGTIWVESEYGKGSVFSLSFNDFKVTPYVEPVTGQLTNGSLFSGLRGRTIAIAEDEESNFLYLEQLLTNEGAFVIHFTNGKTITDYFLSNHFKPVDLILMDIKMPVMDGIQAFQTISKVLPGIPIIAQTAYAMEGDLKRIMELGFTNYIAKPIDKIKLLTMVSQYL